jgi:hypothetical protein
MKKLQSWQVGWSDPAPDIHPAMVWQVSFLKSSSDISPAIFSACFV